LLQHMAEGQTVSTLHVGVDEQGQFTYKIAEA
jgi:hypothetical protein